jgi:drug/metabolite transporter (DMT)-like permease
MNILHVGNIRPSTRGILCKQLRIFDLDKLRFLDAANGIAWELLFYSALGPECEADVLQQEGQSAVTATVSNITLSLKPVLTAIFGLVLVGEFTSELKKMGGCLILTAAIVATLGHALNQA